MAESVIPVHGLSAPEPVGVNAFRWEHAAQHVPHYGSLGVHRDTHYLFFLLEAGTAALLVDFTVVTLGVGELYYLQPNQVHGALPSHVVSGWVLAVEAHLVPTAYRQVLEDQVVPPPPCALAAPQRQQLAAVLDLLGQQLASAATPFQRPVVYSLLAAFLGLAAGYFVSLAASPAAAPRSMLLTQQFRCLLTQQFRYQRRPAAYAAQLHLSASYLNEVVRQATGFPVSYWITHEVLLEAKRLLLFTELSIKEIAYELGLADSAYFSRLFKEKGGLTPSAFRAQYRK